MKHAVNLIQILVVIAIIFPVFHIWEGDKVDQFCKVVEPRMGKVAFINLADERNVKLIGPTDYSVAGGKWQATAVSRSPFSKDSCLIKGVGTKVGIIQMHYGE